MKKLLLTLLFGLPAHAANINDFPATDGNNQICGYDNATNGAQCWNIGTGLSIVGSDIVSSGGGGGGDVFGPASSTDNAVVRFDSTTGKIIQNSTVTISDTGNITGGTYNGNTIGSGSTSGTNTGDQTTITGNAGTATALAANGSNCTSGNYPLGVDASGNVESCTAISAASNYDVFTPYLGIAELRTLAGATGQTAIGWSAVATGTVTAVAITSTNLFTGTGRVNYVSAASAGSTSAIRSNQALALRGVAANEGGFKFVSKAGAEVNVSGSRAFFGMTASLSVHANAEPSSLTNIIGFCWDTTDTTLQVCTNDGAGTATKTNLGASFPANTSQTDYYQFELFCTTNCSSVNYLVTRLNTGDTASGTISSDLPATSQVLSAQLWLNNGATASAVTLAYSNIWVGKPR